MPSNLTEPASGGNQIAAAQVLKRFNVIVEYDAFANSAAGYPQPPPQAAPVGVTRRATELYIGALPEVFITLLLHPQYDRGDFVFEARNYLSWRVVGVNPGDVFGPTTGTVFPGLTDPAWLPITTPQLLPVGEPIHFKLPCGGVESIAIEMDTTSGEAAANQGQDRVVITMSASQ